MALVCMGDKARPEYSGCGLLSEPISSRGMASPEEPEQDWRMQAELHVEETRGALHDLLGRVRGPDVVREIESSVPDDVVITHDGKLLFAYAADAAALAAARGAIEDVLRGDGVDATVRVSHWDDERDRWHQVDPPLSAAEQQLEDAAERDDEALETRTLVASSGKMIRAEFEQTMREWAGRLELQCAIVEHPHLLTTQVAFTVTGPKRKIDEFARGLREEEWQTIRAERWVIASPL
jgi:hypothetical protein